MNNTIYTGDNLDILTGMNSNTVDLIYLDPPFNSKRMYEAPTGSKAAGAAFKDTWTWDDVNDAHLEKMVIEYPYLSKFIQSIGVVHSTGMMAYIAYMTQRLIELQRVLKDTGSIYLHCDPTASHYLKIVMDRIFGRDNFRNDIVWKRSGSKGTRGKTKALGAVTDNILFYGKKDNYVVIPKTIDDSIIFKHSDNKGTYRAVTPLMGDGSLHDCPKYEWNGHNPKHGWRASKVNLVALEKDDRIHYNGAGKPYRKQYQSEYQGANVGSLWTDISIASGKERTGYPTQKPLALLHRIIKASSNEGDIVLDPFAGCATTCVAAHQLNRKWIGIDISPKAGELIADRLQDDGGLFNEFVLLDKVPQRTDIIKTPLNLTTKEKLMKDQKGICSGCNTGFEIRNFEIDHIVPRAKGGGDYYENYQLLCGHCNKVKGARPMEYLRAKVRAMEAVRTSVGF